MAASLMSRGWRMAEKRRALGRGLGALIPSAPNTGAGRPVDVFFAEQRQDAADQSEAATPSDTGTEPALPAHLGPPQTDEAPAGMDEEAAPLTAPEPGS